MKKNYKSHTGELNMGMGLDMQAQYIEDLDKLNKMHTLRSDIHAKVTPRLPSIEQVGASTTTVKGFDFNPCKEIQLNGKMTTNNLRERCNVPYGNNLTEGVFNMSRAKRYTFEFLYDDGSTYKVSGVNWYNLECTDSRGNPAIKYRKMFGDREEIVNVLMSNLAALKIKTKDEIALMRFKPCATLFGEIDKAL